MKWQSELIDNAVNVDEVDVIIMDGVDVVVDN